MKRMWINQPSTLQPLHKLNGTNVLVAAELDTMDSLRVYFLEGPVISMRVPRNTLTNGWLKK